ncbi:hypothetical protein DV515_00001859 [Chloebia gouldiae]|uniref:Uncharacterized protein n=1 Tax=Chloebia gouldiae TaxID=44316 RepID=A0A3L8SXS6_CHLGU|nr:hypothetical protein DV515_00001859 [Chloebia gouldiae]
MVPRFKAMEKQHRCQNVMKAWQQLVMETAFMEQSEQCPSTSSALDERGHSSIQVTAPSMVRDQKFIQPITLPLGWPLLGLEQTPLWLQTMTNDDKQHGSGRCGSPGEPHKPSVKLALHHQALALVGCTEEPAQPCLLECIQRCKKKTLLGQSVPRLTHGRKTSVAALLVLISHHTFKHRREPNEDVILTLQKSTLNGKALEHWRSLNFLAYDFKLQS